MSKFEGLQPRVMLFIGPAPPWQEMKDRLSSTCGRHIPDVGRDCQVKVKQLKKLTNIETAQVMFKQSDSALSRDTNEKKEI